jgi:transposase, IS30 family
MRTYEQLSLDERYQIQTRLGLHESAASIARAIGRHPSTIYRELSRNSDTSCVHPYLAARAAKLARRRRVVKGERQRKIQGALKELVESKLRLSWSPEQICGRLAIEQGISLSHETIYQHVLRDSERLGFYRYCLRFGGYKQHRFKKSRMAERTRERKNWIEDRPLEANDRTELGHWERDCVLGKRGDSALLTMVDRRSRYVVIRRIENLNTDAVAAATLTALRGLPARTLTNDNGVEFQRDESLQRKLGIPIYFCNPKSPWERGTVENMNGLIRQYFPKGSDFDAMPAWAPAAVENTFNFRPRKVLGYKTPYEIVGNQSVNLMTDKTMHFGLEYSDSS